MCGQDWRYVFDILQREIDGLTELVKEADSLKHSCNASSILDTDILTDQMAELTVTNNKVCQYQTTNFRLFQIERL